MQKDNQLENLFLNYIAPFLNITEFSSLLDYYDNPFYKRNWYANSKVEIKYFNHGIEYFVNGKLHREDGPAIEYVNGTREWWINGKRHREDGPAIEYANGKKYWYIDGEFYGLFFIDTKYKFNKTITGQYYILGR